MLGGQLANPPSGLRRRAVLRMRQRRGGALGVRGASAGGEGHDCMLDVERPYATERVTLQRPPVGPSDLRHRHCSGATGATTWRRLRSRRRSTAIVGLVAGAIVTATGDGSWRRGRANSRRYVISPISMIHSVLFKSGSRQMVQLLHELPSFDGLGPRVKCPPALLGPRMHYARRGSISLTSSEASKDGRPRASRLRDRVGGGVTGRAANAVLGPFLWHRGHGAAGGTGR